MLHHSRRRIDLGAVLSALGLVASLPLAAYAASIGTGQGPQIQLTVGQGLLDRSTDGRLVVLFSPAGSDPLDDTDVTGPNAFYGKNAFNLTSGATVSLSGGASAPETVDVDVFGHPHASLADLPAGDYRVQAFFTGYETITRSDGSTVQLNIPCGDGAPNVDGVGSLSTPVQDVKITGRAQRIQLTFNATAPKPEDLNGSEIGGCQQGNYKDTDSIKYVKIRSEALSRFWNRDVFVGATVVLPAGYDASDKKTRYPVIYAQDHWNGHRGAWGFPDNSFADAWQKGVIPGKDGAADRPTPKFILVTFRHETALYDDSYAVNTANLGPWGDAINDELVPRLDSMFNTVAQPYARIQDGGSTGGWESLANTVFRPDLYGACFSYYPDSLDFHRHQAIPLYDGGNAYRRANGSAIPSIRDFTADGKEQILATVEQENHWELTFGTSTRSRLQWDIWNAVFGVQGVNGYPLEPWNKVTGEIYPEAVEYWKTMDMAAYLAANWNGTRNLGEALRGRIHVSVGTWDDYFLNEGVLQFQQRIEQLGGKDWAEVTIIPKANHGGFYKRLDVWTYLELVQDWVRKHAPDGPTPLGANLTSPKTRGNQFDEVIERGGHAAALARQADPKILGRGSDGSSSSKKRGPISASVGRWDPGVKLVAQWSVNGRTMGKPFGVTSGQEVVYKPQNSAGGKNQLVLSVTGTKAGYKRETRSSPAFAI
ncbi:uncharacterized protein PFL1_01846 [Pseudozyma flocculosa PF-1]|uniref:Uncharacterized protein n=1 Tax=Pseudozyma flocculosa TaxID=84751 RepID=A0A5C3EZV3_9BASI|nr:uncharacterized protein PFL1_01846 [Pseudozyma flocculosa PF-1]EPQ30320.1 hypothetical protein PFL1_01846 [Pseudozyma flocculosa PF-1]SPO37390.1 uncharacterized protein PSFLO_02863 [Pseudozyma flocculosa]